MSENRTQATKGEVRARRPFHRCPGPNCHERDVSRWVNDGVYAPDPHPDKPRPPREPFASTPLVFDERGEAEYRGYRIERASGLDTPFFGEDACSIRKMDEEDPDVYYWVEMSTRYGSGAVTFPTVAMAIQLIDYWVEADTAMSKELAGLDV